MNNTTHKNIRYKNNGEIPRSDVIYPKTINPHKLFYQCSKYGPDCLFSKLMIKDFNDKPHFSKKGKISGRTQMNTLLNNNHEEEIKRCDKIIHKAMRVLVEIHQTNKKLHYSST